MASSALVCSRGSLASSSAAVTGVTAPREQGGAWAAGVVRPEPRQRAEAAAATSPEPVVERANREVSPEAAGRPVAPVRRERAGRRERAALLRGQPAAVA